MLCTSTSGSSSLMLSVLFLQRYEYKGKNVRLERSLTIKSKRQREEETCRQLYGQIRAIQQYHPALHDILVARQPLVPDLRRGGLAADAARPPSRQESQHPGSSPNRDARPSTIEIDPRMSDAIRPLSLSSRGRFATRRTRSPLAKLAECEIPRRPHRTFYSGNEITLSGCAAQQ